MVMRRISDKFCVNKFAYMNSSMNLRNRKVQFEEIAKRFPLHCTRIGIHSCTHVCAICIRQIHFHNCSSHKPLKLIELCVNWSMHHQHVFIHLNCLIWLPFFVVASFSCAYTLHSARQNMQITFLSIDLLLLLLFFLIEFNYKMLMRKIALEKQFTFSLGRHVNAQTVSMPMAQ